MFGAAVEAAIIIMSQMPLVGGVDGFAAAPAHCAAGSDDGFPLGAKCPVGLVVAVADSGTRRLGRHGRSYPH